MYSFKRKLLFLYKPSEIIIDNLATPKEIFHKGELAMK